MKSLDCKLPLASRSNRCAYVPTPRYGDFLSILTQPYCGQQKCTAVNISIRGKPLRNLHMQRPLTDRGERAVVRPFFKSRIMQMHDAWIGSVGISTVYALVSPCFGYSSSKPWIHPRIHCRYSIRTDQYLACLDILLVKHGLTNAFTEKSEHPSHAHLEICHQDILAANHGFNHAFTVDIPSQPISTWRVWIFCWSSMDSPTHSQRNPNTLHMPISKSVIRIF